MKKIVIASMLLSLLVLPLATFATPPPQGQEQSVGVGSLSSQSPEGLLKETGTTAKFKTQTSLTAMIGEVIKILLTLLGVVVLVLIIYAGFMWMTAGGNPEQVDKAKKWLTNAVIGLAIVLAAYAISSFVLTNLMDVTSTFPG